MWDNRLPHATCNKLTGFDSREVIYMSYIPNVTLNMNYTTQQTEHFLSNIQPPAYVDGHTVTDKDYNNDALTPFQREILHIK